MSFSTTRGPGAATPASVNPAAGAPTNSASPDETHPESITVVLSIIGAVLTLASVFVAVLQYRFQRQRRLDVERDGQPIGMNPQRPAQEAEGTVAAPPS